MRKRMSRNKYCGCYHNSFTLVLYSIIKMRGGMNKKLKAWLIGILIIIGLLISYKLLFIRVVNYEIAGVKIPSRYNILTGTVKPITNYKGKGNLPTAEPKQTGKVGLSDEQAVIAQLRWAIFAEWANAHREYKGWQTNENIFKMAHDAFKKEMEASGKALKIQNKQQ